MAKTVIEAGFFTMDDVVAVEKIKDLAAAKAYAVERVEAQLNAKPANISKAKAHIAHAKSVVQLMMTLTNYVLAHPSEHLKVIR